MKESCFRLNDDGSISLLWRGDPACSQRVLSPGFKPHEVVNILHMAYSVGRKDLQEDLRYLLNAGKAGI